MSETKLAVIDGETLMDMRLPPTRFCVQTLLPQGVTVLGGAPKIGKSWLVLDLCVRIAKGEMVWGMPTTKGTTLYLCLEDTLRRVQERLCCITDEVPANAYFATCANTLPDGLCDQIRQFVTEHPDTVLVAIDTFQMIRSSETDISYANDYQEIGRVKKMADEPFLLLPKEMISFLDFMRETVFFSGSNSELADRFNVHAGVDVSAKGLKQMMNKWRYQLEEQGVQFRSYRSNGQRLVEVSFSALKSDVSDSSDEESGSAKTSVPCDPCVPEDGYGAV